jgi:hypothetical protein
MESDAFLHWNETPGSTLWIRGKRKYFTLGWKSLSELRTGY